MSHIKARAAETVPKSAKPTLDRVSSRSVRFGRCPWISPVQGPWRALSAARRGCIVHIEAGPSGWGAPAGAPERPDLPRKGRWCDDGADHGGSGRLTAATPRLGRQHRPGRDCEQLLAGSTACTCAPTHLSCTDDVEPASAASRDVTRGLPRQTGWTGWPLHNFETPGCARPCGTAHPGVFLA